MNVQVAHQEGCRKRETDGHEGVVEDRQWTPANQSHWDPDQVAVAV